MSAKTRKLSDDNAESLFSFIFFFVFRQSKSSGLISGTHESGSDNVRRQSSSRPPKNAVTYNAYAAKRRDPNRYSKALRGTLAIGHVDFDRSIMTVARGTAAADSLDYAANVCV